MDTMLISLVHAKNIIQEIGYKEWDERQHEQMTKTGAVIVKIDGSYYLHGYAWDNSDIKAAIVHAFKGGE